MQFTDYRDQKDLVDTLYYRLAQLSDQINELENERDRIADKHLEAVMQLRNFMPAPRG